MISHPDIIKAAFGGAFSLLSWIMGQVTQNVEVLPEIVKAADTPLILAGMAYAILHLWRSWQKEREARMSDIAKAFDRMESDAKAAMESRERLVKATTEQVEEFRALRRAIEAKKPLYQHDPDRS